MNKTLLVFSFLLLIISQVYAQDSLQVRRLSKLYTCANYENIRDLGPYRFCVVNDTGYVKLYQNLNKSPIWFPDTIYSCNNNYYAVDDSGIVYYQNESIQERWRTAGKCYYVSPDDEWLYVATSGGFEKIHNDPWCIYRYDFPEGGNWVTHRGAMAYFIANNGYIYSIYTYDELNLTIVDSLNIGAIPVEIYYDSPYIYVALGDQGWKIINVSNSYHLRTIVPPNNEIQAYDIEVDGYNFWISSETDGLYHFNIEDPEDIIFIENIPIYTNDFSVLSSHGRIATIHENNSLDIFNWEDQDSVYQVDHYGQSRVLDFFVFPSERVRYQGIVLDQYSGIRRIGLDIPNAPGDFSAEYYDTFGKLIDGEDSLFAVQTFDNNISIFKYDNSQDEDLAIAWTIPLDEELNDLDIIYDHLFTLSDESGLCVYQLTTTDPPLMVYQNESVSGDGMDLAPLYLCVVDQDYGIKTYSYNDLQVAVNEEGSLQLNTSPSDLLLYDSFAFISCGEDGFKIVDCYDVENPQIASETDTDGFTYDITMGGGYFYVADGSEGVLVYDIHNPYAPELVGYYDTPGNSTGVDAWHENCGVADSSGVYILRYAFATGAPETKTSTPSDFRIESIYPNPFNPDCHVKINIPESGLLELKVFNILGEEVSSLSKSRVKEGYFEYRFFGKNFASGIYFLQVELEGYGIQTTKMVLMK